MEIVGTLILILLIVRGIALWKFHVPGTILWGAIGVIVYIGFVYNEMGKGVNLKLALISPSVVFPPVLVLLIGLLGLISLLIGIYIEIKKRK